ncbi:hypothetical protein PHYC_02053 [Phycisphaerales bacterium]|nr:hypothetical protein PHYC_02053 [Phycisphaerales bacterium]
MPHRKVPGDGVDRPKLAPPETWVTISRDGQTDVGIV